MYIYRDIYFFFWINAGTFFRADPILQNSEELTVVAALIELKQKVDDGVTF